MGASPARHAIVFGLATLLFAWVVACASDDGGGDETSDTSAESLAFGDAIQTDDDTASPVDAAEGGDDSEADSPETFAGEATALAANEQPGFDVLPIVSVTMGHMVPFDLAPYIDDAEDSDAALVLSWSALHVGLSDGPEHLLHVVGPVDWFGEELIELTVTDKGGLSASSMLKVIVAEVTPPDPITPPPVPDIHLHLSRGWAGRQRPAVRDF